MRKFFKWFAFIVGGTGIVLALAAVSLTVLGMPEYEVPSIDLTVDRSAERLAKGRQLTRSLCMRCHYNSVDKKLQGATLDRVPWRLKTLRAANITSHPEHGIGAWTDGDIAFVLRTGVHPKTKQLLIPIMPRWPRLATEDLEAIVAFLRSDDPLVAPSDESRPPVKTTLWAKYFAYVEWEPFGYPRQEIPRPSDDDPVVYGEYLVDAVFQCHGCHDVSRAPSDVVDVRGTEGYLGGGMPLTGVAIKTVTSANITPHDSGLGDWTAEDLRRALVDGFRPNGEVLRWPMRRYGELTANDVEAIYAYLRTVPPIERTVKRPEVRNAGAKVDAGLHVFRKYGCAHCHGDVGQGLVDLRGVDERFATDDDLAAFLRDPTARYPDTIMPRWDGVVDEADYVQLVEISRRLSREQEERLGDRKD